MIYLEKQRLAFKNYHDDDDIFTNEQEISKINDGNFLAFLKYEKILGDKCCCRKQYK